jgi:tetratricopeptide (TPR) repeat protein
MVLYKGDPAVRFRFAGKSGIGIVDFVLRTNSNGQIRIVNLCNHAMGYDVVEQGRQTVAPMLADLDQSFLERLVNKPNINPADLQRFGDLAKKFGKQDFEGAVSVYQSLPAELKETMAATMMNIAALQNLRDDEKYKQALKEAGKRFKSASFEFMLVDACFLDKQYDQAIECIDHFMEALEKDAALLALKSLMLKSKGDIQGARSTLAEALKMEPECVFAHAKGLDVLMAAKDFPALRDSMIFLEKTGGYAFKGHLDDPLWEDFRKAPESAAWR